MKKESIVESYNGKEYKLIPCSTPGRCMKCYFDRWDAISCIMKLDGEVNCFYPVRGYWKETFRSKLNRFIKENIVDDDPYDKPSDESHSETRYVDV